PIGHIRWTNGGVYYSGFTTAMAPNAGVKAGSQATITPLSGATGNASNFGQNVAMDWDSVDENDGGPTYMSLAASSNHPGGVNAVFGDGSVRYVRNTVDPTVCRAHEAGFSNFTRRPLMRTGACWFVLAVVLLSSCWGCGSNAGPYAGKTVS